MARLTRALGYDRLTGSLPVRVRSDRREIDPSYFRGAKGDYGLSAGWAGSATASAIARASGPRPGNSDRFPGASSWALSMFSAGFQRVMTLN